MSSLDPPPPSPSPLESPLDPSARQRLLEIARQSIRQGLEQGHALQLAAEQEAPALQAERASFVTLERQGRLRGCIGHLDAITALACDVAENAYAAAFRDPRFAPLSAQEFDDLEIHISVLTPSQPLTFSNEAELLAAIEPGVDGLILSEGHRRGTFLPSVWEQLPTREEFLRHLKQKAGLAPDYWSPQIQVARYRTESFGD
ncbi:MAG: AmmeMemoRadiSam system protein A [Chromatiaceae bacterium]|nr:AmmeMemoRadiSam system protein A [Chromatiaceae bacterium]